MYRCHNCGHIFEDPNTEHDDIGDESYDYCPKCGGDDFSLIPEPPNDAWENDEVEKGEG